MAKTFKSFVEYLKENASSSHFATPSLVPAVVESVTMAPAVIATPSHVPEELKEMKDILLTLDNILEV